MKKRLALCLVLCLFLFTFFSQNQWAQPAPLAADGLPNVIVILTDDQRWDTLCANQYGMSAICQLPAPDRPMPVVESELIANGVLFTNALSTNPACCPARASLLSGGFHSHHTNVLSNRLPNGSVQQFTDTTTIATLLQQQGYQTALIGKYLNGYTALVDEGTGEGYVPPGWDSFYGSYIQEDWLASLEFVVGSSTAEGPGTGIIQAITDGTYLTDYERDRALDFINTTCPGQSCAAPFFLYLSLEAPHDPATPAARHAALFTDVIYQERGWGELPDDDLTDKPLHVQNNGPTWTPGADDAFHQDQLRSLRAVDEAVAAILDTLEQKNLLSNTVIIFASDNGYLWGEHKLEGKFTPYEESIRVPLVIRKDGVAPHLEDALVSLNLDLGPTILELAQVTPIGSDGDSLLPLLNDPSLPWRDSLLLERFSDGGESAPDLPSWTGIRTADNWKYIEYAAGERELYDLTADPYELNSQHANPAYATVLANLAADLSQLSPGVVILDDSLPDPQTIDLPGATLNQPYDFQFYARGGNGQYVWSVFLDTGNCTGSLPAGLSLGADGHLTGSPTQAGAWEVCIQVADTSQSPQPGNSRPQAYVKKYRLTTTATLTCAGLIQEAENAVLTDIFAVSNDTAASNGQYIHVPAGNGNSLNAPDEAHKATLCFTVTTAGTYRLNGTVYAAATNDNSFFVKVDGAPTEGYLWDTLVTVGYEEDYVNSRAGIDPVEVFLAIGDHTVDIYWREDDTRLDKLELELQTLPCSSQAQEAEAGQWVGSFVAVDDGAASGGQYIHIPPGTGNSQEAPDENNKATYCFTVNTAGLYRLKGWVYAETSLDNSFWVKLGGNPAAGYLWDTVEAAAYTEDYVSDRGLADPVEWLLEPGDYLVDVYWREDGTRLDKLELTLQTTCSSAGQEAEVGSLVGDFVIGNDPAASGGQYIHVPNGTGNEVDAPNELHKVSYCFTVTAAGTYRIRGRVLA
ncbi:MAG: sulfatase-like hydrolase/transferase, partial [Chloroflexota bacterium]